jgi:short-subunit dehydrogenase
MPAIANVLITGASGGLGTALARRLAAPGRRLSLWGRDVPKLEAIAEACRSEGAEVLLRSIDLSDLQSALLALASEDQTQPFDMVIFAAGQGDVRIAGELVENSDLVARLGHVNYVAPSAMAAEMAKRMAARRHGHIVLIGSAAGFHALPFAAAYASSKAGLTRFADALRLGMKTHNVAVTMISPGFIDTAAAHRVPGPKPFILSAESAATRIIAAAERGSAHVILPWPFAALRFLDRLLPSPLRDRLLLALAPPGA